MRILVDEMPKEAKECCFYKIDMFQLVIKCAISWMPCKVENCPYLKEYKPVEDDCK